jgi:hypothetical protein
MIRAIEINRTTGMILPSNAGRIEGDSDVKIDADSLFVLFVLFVLF